MKKPGIIIAVIAVLVIAIIVVVLNVSKEPETTPANTNTEPINESSLSGIMQDIKGISGQVVSVNKNGLVVNAIIIMQDTTKEPIRHNVAISINNTTTIKKTTFPSQEELVGNTGPITSTETTIKLSDLKVGDTIDARSLTNIYDNLKANTPFTASTINVIVYE